MMRIVLLLLISTVVSFGFDVNQWASRSGVSIKQLEPKIDLTRDTTCFIRHIKIYKAPKWVAKIVLANGKELFFSSPKSMFELYLQPGRWHDLQINGESDFRGIFVTDFQTLEPTDARKAFFVYGSNVISPAGDDLVAFKSYYAAEQFAKKHNGKRILKFSEINLALINLLNGRI